MRAGARRIFAPPTRPCGCVSSSFFVLFIFQCATRVILVGRVSLRVCSFFLFFSCFFFFLFFRCLTNGFPFLVIANFWPRRDWLGSCSGWFWPRIDVGNRPFFLPSCFEGLSAATDTLSPAFEGLGERATYVAAENKIIKKCVLWVK